MKKPNLEFRKLRSLILSTDTLHHRYFINTLEKSKINIEKYLFETTFVKPKFKLKNFYKNEENAFEKRFFFKKISKNLDKKKIIRIKNVNSESSLNILKKLKFDVGIVFGCRKIDLKVIKLFKFGIINIHRGVIGKYRGLDSDLWAIYNKDYKNIGACIHFIDKNLDTGPIIKQKKIKITSKTKIFHLRYLTTVLATEMLIALSKKKIVNLTKFKKQQKFGKYFSFMPYYKKREAKINLDKYISRLV